MLLLRLISCYLAVTVSFNSLAQPRMVSPGERVPNVSIGSFVNTDRTDTLISQHAGKLLILDFWMKSCGVCIEQFPKLEQLQRKFGDKVSIIAVGFEVGNDGEIKKLLDWRKKRGQPVNVPSTIIPRGDMLLLTMFPFGSLPHTVWIDSAGRLIGTGDHTDVGEANIRKCLAGQPIVFNKPLIKRDFEPDMAAMAGEVIGGSIWTKYNDTLTSSPTLGWKSGAFYNQMFFINQSIISFYKEVYKDQYEFLEGDIGNKRIIIESRKKEVYPIRSDLGDSILLSEMRKKMFSYQLYTPVTYGVQDALHLLRKDLDRFFLLQSQVENRAVAAYVLSRLPGKSIKRSKGYQPSEYTPDYRYVKIAGGQVSELVTYLNKIVTEPVINATNYDLPIDIEVDLPSGFATSDIRAILEKYGFALEKKTLTLPLFVLRDITPGDLVKNGEE